MRLAHGRHSGLPRSIRLEASTEDGETVFSWKVASVLARSLRLLPHPCQPKSADAPEQARHLTRLAQFDQVAVGVSQKAPNLSTPVIGRSEKLSASLLQGFVGDVAVLDPERHGVAHPVWFAGGAKVTSGLSGVGPPPVTSRTQDPPKRSTTLDSYPR